MSKKETRRAARQAFPKATGGEKAGAGARAKGSGGGKNAGSTRQRVKPPSLKRAAIQGAVVAALYFLIVRFIFWRAGGAGTAVAIIFPVMGFFVYTGIVYAIDRYKYQRSLRKLQGPSK
jgi:hypothetical protein